MSNTFAIGVRTYSIGVVHSGLVVANACVGCRAGFLWWASIVSYRVRLAITSFDVFRVKSVPIMRSHSLGMDAMIIVWTVRSSIFLP